MLLTYFVAARWLDVQQEEGGVAEADLGSILQNRVSAEKFSHQFSNSQTVDNFPTRNNNNRFI
jgi:hypothetical protein